MRVEENQLKAFILDSGLLTPDKLVKAEQESAKLKKTLREVLLNKALIKEEELLHLEAYILGIPFVDLSKETVDPEILHIIPEPIARKHNVVSFKKSGTNLEVAMLDPGDLQTLEFIRKKEGLRILPRLTTPDSVKHILKQYQKSLEAEFGEIIKKDIGDAALKFTKGGGEELEAEAEDLKKMAEDLPVIRIVDTLIRHAILQLASDIHIEPQEKEVLVRYRIDGILHDAMTLPKQIATGIVARIKVMANLKLDEHRLPQDGRFKIETEEYRFSFRISVLPVMEGEKIVMRLLPEGAKGFSLEELGFLGVNLDRIHKAIKRPTGIILATGPTGSGKTTTLYTILEMLNTPGVNISTIEDPIEYRIPRINQTQVRPDIGLSFANGLRTLLRQDPNIIMVGEIRDTETTDLAIQASLTGHLVFSTIHTNNATGALPRLLDMHAEPYLIASTVTCIVGQRVVRKICNTCKVPKEVSEIVLNQIKETLGKLYSFDPKKPPQLYSGKGCKECNNTGYLGRIGIYEVLVVSEKITRMILARETSQAIGEQAKEEGMITMKQDGFLKVIEGISSIEEVLRVAED